MASATKKLTIPIRKNTNHEPNEPATKQLITPSEVEAANMEANTINAMKNIHQLAREKSYSDMNIYYDSWQPGKEKKRKISSW